MTQMTDAMAPPALAWPAGPMDNDAYVAMFDGIVDPAALSDEHLLRVLRYGGLYRPERPRDFYKALWRRACRLALSGLGREGRQAIRPAYAGGSVWCGSDLPREYVFRCDLLQRAHMIAGPVMKGMWLCRRERKYRPDAALARDIRLCGPRYLAKRRMDSRLAAIVGQGAARTLGTTARLHVYVYRASMARAAPGLRATVGGSIKDAEIYLRLGDGYLRHVYRPGLHALPPGQVFLVLEAGEAAPGGGGTWYAPVSWCTRSSAGKRTDGWLVWSYEPGSVGMPTRPPVVDFVRRGKTLEATMKAFWADYARSFGPRMTPDERALLHAQIAATPLPPPLEFPVQGLSDADAEAFAELGIG